MGRSTQSKHGFIITDVLATKADDKVTILQSWKVVDKGGTSAGATFRIDTSPENVWHVIRDIDSENSYYLRMPDKVSDVVRLDDFHPGSLLELGTQWSEIRLHPRFGKIKVLCSVVDIKEENQDATIEDYDVTDSRETPLSLGNEYGLSVAVRQSGTPDENSASRYSYTIKQAIVDGQEMRSQSELSVSFAYLPSNCFKRLLIRFGVGAAIAKKGLGVMYLSAQSIAEVAKTRSEKDK
mmetsp:Transcript_27713/g.41947  ORF Transcript_27713/g.41947 Transcript_27713/m.41947 type:complete len:238 (-) Transcript_27713:9-722(-)